MNKNVQKLNSGEMFKKRLIQIILFLTAGNTALGGNYEGNFLRTVKLLAQFDPVLNKLVYTEESKVKYLSWKIQNEVIELLASETLKILCEEIRNSQCFTIIMNSTQDITKLDQTIIMNIH
ncbi:zinc finger MYM-type protein 1-like [Aphis craccivora]|uniref:Zinc finger MYM-type protein 1-like n=1 Tax=Aphis craccivora TaxID=307492 RepID=A0A6G0Y2B3_APHCR|nr:zinc finger MYM-type protein 1-like [Aphis craccivora]